MVTIVGMEIGKKVTTSLVSDKTAMPTSFLTGKQKSQFNVGIMRLPHGASS